MNLFDCKAKTAMDKTRQEIDLIDSAMVVYGAVFSYCRANGKASPFTKRKLEAIVKRVAEIKRRDKGLFWACGE